MRKLTIVLLAGIFLAGFAATAFASDWDVAGKILTGVEGVRIVTGGAVDPIGAMISVVRGGTQGGRGNGYAYGRQKHVRRAWQPNYIWRKEYIPEHEEYSARFGKVIVEGHYIRYQVENGGCWITTSNDNFHRDGNRDGFRH